MRIGRSSRLMPHSTFKIAASTSCDLGTRSLWPYREKRTGSHGSSATTIVGTPPAAKLRTAPRPMASELRDRKSTRLNSSHGYISYAVFCLKKKKNKQDKNNTEDIILAPLHPTDDILDKLINGSD